MYSLFVSRNDIIKNSMLLGSIDADKLLPYVKIAQDKYMENLLGSVLYKKIQSDILVDPTLSGYTGEYLEMIPQIKNVLIWYSVAEYIPFSSIMFQSNGSYKIDSDSYSAPSKTELEYLLNKALDNAELFSKRLQDFLCANSNVIVEYNQSTGKSDNVYPDQSNQYFCGINL